MGLTWRLSSDAARGKSIRVAAGSDVMLVFDFKIAAIRSEGDGQTVSGSLDKVAELFLDPCRALVRERMARSENLLRYYNVRTDVEAARADLGRLRAKCDELDARKRQQAASPHPGLKELARLEKQQADAAEALNEKAAELSAGETLLAAARVVVEGEFAATVKAESLVLFGSLIEQREAALEALAAKIGPEVGRIVGLDGAARAAGMGQDYEPRLRAELLDKIVPAMAEPAAVAEVASV